nr:hypothetical protein [Hyphomonas sp. Mor2]
MLNTWRGLVLAAGVLAIPALAQAECPPEDSLDRYAQTARDALVALDGVVPEDQLQTMRDRYVAMSILRWNGQGRDVILNEESAANGISQCIDSGRCDAEANERSAAGPRTISPFPSDRLVTWANRQLECETVSPIVEQAAADPTPVEPEQAPETEIAEIAEAQPETIVETIDDAPTETVIATQEDLEPDESVTAETELVAEIAPEIEPSILSDAIETDSTSDPEATPTDDTMAILETDIEPEIETSGPAIAAPATRSSTAVPAVAENAIQRLVREGAVSVMLGDFDAGVEAISQSCYLDAEQADLVPSCELVFDYYQRLAVNADPIRFLAFTDQLCRVDYARGCSSLATYFGVESTAEAHMAAIKFYDRACNTGDAEACAAASDYFLTGRASVADPVRARDTMYRSCDLGRLASCQDLAEFYARGVGGETDITRALELNDLSCPTAQNSLADTCVAAAKFVLLNVDAGPDRAARVRAFTERACRIGHDEGCAWHAENLEYGIGGVVDLSGAKRARATACQFGHRASCAANS